MAAVNAAPTRTPATIPTRTLCCPTHQMVPRCCAPASKDSSEMLDIELVFVYSLSVLGSWSGQLSSEGSAATSEGDHGPSVLGVGQRAPRGTGGLRARAVLRGRLCRGGRGAGGHREGLRGRQDSGCAASNRVRCPP